MFETVGFYLTIVIAVVSVALEIFEVVALVTKSKEDDARVSGWKTFWEKTRKSLEYFPHVNIPITKVLVSLIGSAKNFIKPKEEAVDKSKPSKVVKITKKIATKRKTRKR